MSQDLWRDEQGNEIEDHDRGLRHDLGTLLGRRRALTLFGGLGVAGALAACSTGGDSPASPSTASTTGGTSSSSPASTSGSSGSGSAPTAEVPDETQGPFPGDGSNGTNVLDDSGIVRSDLRSSFGSSTTTAEGVPLTVNLTVTDTADGYAALSGAAVYIWHCDREGRYSLYSRGVEQENYLRGVQETDAEGTVTFRTIFPAAYQGRWPHIHFEVYESVANATASGPIVKTSQIALPQAACEAVYGTEGYEQSVRNLAGTSLTRDMVFGDDGGVHQLATVTGSVDTGYVANLTIGV